MPTVMLDLAVLESRERLRGIGRYAADLALSLPRSSGDLRVLALESLSWLGRPRINPEPDAAVRRLLGRVEPLMRERTWARRQRLALPRATRLADADLVHHALPTGTPWRSVRGRRLISCHDLIPLRYPERYTTFRDGFACGRRATDFRRMRRADHILASSEATAADLVGLLGIAASKVSVVHLGIDIGRWPAQPQAGDDEARKRLGVAERPYLFFVGACEWRKNPVGMLAGLARARRHRSARDLTLAWAGKMGSYEHWQLDAITRTLGIEDALIRLGFVSDADLGPLYRGAVGTLFVSRAEGFGYPIVEAMASGCPVISADCSSSAEIAGDATLAVDPEDHAAIGDAIVQLAVASSEQRASLVAAGRARARRFSAEAMALRTIEIYRACLE